jgi:hypothetical protein
MALYNTEMDILKADPNDLDEKNKKNQRMLHRNPLLEKFYQGQTDQKYVQDYYEVLKKADQFIKKSDKVKYGTAADKNGMSYGKKDKWGRRHEHYGFFDPKSKNYGKTLEEVLKNEMNERRTKDDDYELLEIYNNERILDGLTNSFDVVETTNNGDKILSDITKQIKKDRFPINIIRNNNNVINKIEQLTDFLHVKRIDDEYRQLEFFLNLKYKTDKLSEDDKIFKELINIENVWVYNDYGELDSYKIEKFKKRIVYNDTHEVFKFFCKKMDVIKK